MYPRLFGFVKSWGLLLAVSFVLGILLSVRRGRQRGIEPDTVMDISFAVMVSSLIGVRLAYVLTHLGQFDPWYRIFFIWDGGLTLYGGVLLAIAAVWWSARRRGIPFLRIADVLAPGVILGIGITRIGCFLAGCCFGKPTELPWGVHFPATCRAGTEFGDHAIHPAQLYSSAAGFAIFGLLLWLEKPSAPAGLTFGRFLLFYGIARFWLEFTRFVEPDQYLALGLSNNQWISLAMVIVGLFVVLRAVRAHHVQSA
jgi:phosphatidylglycerol:prolipoprotein diacylglycerol transferase